MFMLTRSVYRLVVLSSLCSLMCSGCSESLRGWVYNRGESSSSALSSYPSVQYGHIDSITNGEVKASEGSSGTTSSKRLKVKADNGADYWFDQSMILDWTPQVGDRVKLFFDKPTSSSAVSRVLRVDQAVSAPAVEQDGVAKKP
jgi:hypothetical protein